jgi:AcrR family transcriptional regulator
MGRPSDARQQLIGAAREVIYANSYEAVTVDELCAAAGVNKSSFYHFFSSKQELVLATLDTAVTAQALLAYFEGVMLLAKGRNDPALIATLRTGTLSLMQYQGVPAR